MFDTTADAAAWAAHLQEFPPFGETLERLEKLSTLIKTELEKDSQWN